MSSHSCHDRGLCADEDAAGHAWSDDDVDVQSPARTVAPSFLHRLSSARSPITPHHGSALPHHPHLSRPPHIPLLHARAQYFPAHMSTHNNHSDAALRPDDARGTPTAVTVRDTPSGVPASSAQPAPVLGNIAPSPSRQEGLVNELIQVNTPAWSDDQFSKLLSFVLCTQDAHSAHLVMQHPKYVDVPANVQDICAQVADSVNLSLDSSVSHLSPQEVCTLR